jgi:hypothetical protein
LTRPDREAALIHEILLTLLPLWEKTNPGFEPDEGGRLDVRRTFID